jgi:DNA polymerase
MAETAATIAALLRWYEDSGVDLCVDEQPVDRFAASLRHSEAAASPSARAAAAPSAVPAAAPIAPPLDERGRTPRAAPFSGPSLATPSSAGPQIAGEAPLGTAAAAAKAQSLAAACHSLEELKAAIAGFEGLAIRATATNLVFADGNPASGFMLIGEAPGAEEDRLGLPFVGASGRLLDRMLAAIGRGRESAYIANIVNWRPPGNRKPQPQEVAVSLPFIERHIELVRPSVVVLLGDTAARALLRQEAGITKLRGRWFDLALPRLGQPIPALPTYHPAFLLRSPAQKRQSWRDMLLAQGRVANPKTLDS